MKKLTYILILSLILPFLGFSQTDTTIIIENKIIPKYQLNLDLNFLGVGLSVNAPINDKYDFTFEFNGGFIVNYFPIYFSYSNYSKTLSLEHNAGYIDRLSFKLGAVVHSSKHWENSISVKLGIPFAYEYGSNYGTPYGGVSFQLFYKLLPTISVGTNIDIGFINVDRVVYSGISTSFLKLRLNLDKH